MTVIAGLVDEDERVWLGADSAGVAGYSITTRADAKVFKNGDYGFAFAGSFRAGQLLRYALKPPKPPAEGLESFLVTTFVNEVRKVFKDGGYTRIEDNEESTDSSFLLAVHGRLFMIEQDFQVGESSDGFSCAGVGEEFSLGVLYATRDSGVAPRTRITKAMEAADHFSGGVVKPFKIVRI